MIDLSNEYKYKVGKQVSPVVPTATEPTHAVNLGQVEEIAGKRTRKEVTNTTEYTTLPEDVDKVLDFTANAGEEINLIINTGVIPANKSIQFISSGNNTVIPVAGSGVTLAQTEGSKLKSKGKGSFVEILSTTVAETFAVTGDLEKETISGKDVHLKSPNTSSEVRFYDSETNDVLYFYMRNNAAENIFEIGSKNSAESPEVTAMFFDRGKDFTVSKGYFRSLSQQYGLIIQSPSGDTNFKNPSGNIAIRATDNGIQVVRVESAAGTIPDTLLWDSANSGGGSSITNITEIPNRSYNDLQDLPQLKTTFAISISLNNILIPFNNDFGLTDLLDYPNHHVSATGSSALTWNLRDNASDMSGRRLTITNKSTQPLTLNTESTSDIIWDKGSDTNTTTVPVGETWTLLFDDSDWVVIGKY